MRALVAFILLGMCVSALALESTQRHPSSQSYSLKRGAHRRVTQRVQGGTVNFGGGIVRIGEYYATILVGGQPVNVQVDTGSSSLAIPEALCSNCVAASHPRYSSSLSSTFSPCNAGGCTFSLRYGDGSGVDGTLASDVITIGNVSARAELGLIKREINSFGNYDVPGILGVGFANINFDRRFPTVLDEISRTTGMPNLFGMCLTLDGGAWDVGFVNMARSQGPLQYVPVNPDRGYYSVTLKSVSVGTSVSGDLSNVAAIVDSGTTLFVVPQFWMNSFTNTLHSLNLPGLPQLFGSDGCASISAAEVSTFPTITIRLDAGNGGSLDLSLPPSSYLVPLEGQYCLGIAAMDDNMFILGDVVMENYYVVFDHDAPRVGFGPVNSQNCPSTVAASSGAAPSGAHFLKISQGTSSWGLLVAGAAGVFVMLSCIAIVAWCLRRPSSSVAYKPVEVPSQLSVSEAEALNQMPVAQV